MERHHSITKEFRECEYASKLKKAIESQNRSFNNIKYKEGDSVYFQDMNKKGWYGPVKVFCHRGRDVWVFTNGSLKKVADCKVQPHLVDDDHETVETKTDEDNSKFYHKMIT